MSRAIRRVSALLVVLLLALVANLVYVQVVHAGSYVDKPGNSLAQLRAYAAPRGPIVVDGADIAESKATGGAVGYARSYPDGPLYAAVTGYDSLVYGRTGIEAAEQGVLSGSAPSMLGQKLERLLTGQPPAGGSVTLTLNAPAQRAAYQAMRGADGAVRAGAVVALDPRTGAVLAAVSTPSFDPNLLSSPKSSSVEAAWDRLSANASQPLLDRVFDQVYPPGSTFKVVVAAAALRAGLTAESPVFAPVGFRPYQPTSTAACPTAVDSSCVQNFQGEQCNPGSSSATLAFAFAKSCNTAFSALAVDRLGGSEIADEAALFGFSGPYTSTTLPDLCDPPALTTPIPACGSNVGSTADLSDPGLLSHTAFGQQDVRMTPLEGAMMAAAVANDGVLMTPYLVAGTAGPSGGRVSSATPTRMSEVLDPSQDAQLQQMMVDVVTQPEGTGGPAAIRALPGVVVGGKTGTADTDYYSKSGASQPDAWFIGYAAQAGVPRIAVAVILENAGVSGNEVTGGLAAAPVAKAVMTAYLRSISRS